MNDTFKRIIVLCTVFAAAFFTVYAFRAWQGGYGIFGQGEVEDGGQFTPEHATLESKPALDPSQVPGLIRTNDEMVTLVEEVTPAVVSINTEIMKRERVLDPLRGQIYERDRLMPGLGSGVIVSAEGHVITNHHVIEGHKKIRVTLHDGRSLPATLVNSDKLLDIAVLRIKSGKEDETFEALKFADSDQVKVGQLAIAVGNPFGLGESVTVGRISARDRSLSDDQRDLFQTDAAINPGNSGGPLLNHLGEIIAINASIYSEDLENPGFQGIGFSIPSNEVKRTLEYILDKGRPVHGYLGLETRDFNNYLRSVYKYQGQGVVVGGVTPGSPAAKAGLQRHDIITAYQGEGVTTTASFLNRVKRSKVGSEAKIAIHRGSETLILSAIVAEADPFAIASEVSTSGRLASDDAIITAVGLTVRNPPQFSRLRRLAGVIVTQVAPNSLAASIGIRPNDLLLEINGSQIRGSEDFYLRLVATAAVQQTQLRVIRGNASKVLTLPQVPRVD
ncbi:trypsin-like peptidase domain-containing protein [Verrucomicrobiaceae bacterium 227]